MKSIDLSFPRFRLFPVFAAVLLLAACASPSRAPVRDGSGVASSAQQPQAVEIAARASGLHIVQRGDTLLSIARQYGVSLPELVRWNELSDPNQIQVGQSIRIAPEQAVAAASIPAGETAVSTPVPVPGAGSASVSGSAGVSVKQGPLGGREPYSDGAWARVAPAGVQAPVAASEQTEATAEADGSGAAVPAAPAAGTAGGQWAWPATGKLIAGYNEASNKGVDIAGSVGDPVLAAAAGKVAYAGSGLRGYGKLVVIKHDQDFTSVYAHNDKLLVKEDDQVVQGQKIAELGSSEADRPKLHFEIRKLGRAIDPMQYLPAR
ncbi:MAG: peptidoglycan DD-metalloendopeptidase family protein [Thauera sp.]|jgi:lipoprotein NlpD|nr:peptidoglycan DD-metalloendopeptidase family protein [Thauera sp.]